MCETTGDVIPESVVHLWGAADAAARNTSADAVVVLNRLSELGARPRGELACGGRRYRAAADRFCHECSFRWGKTYETRRFVPRSREQLRALREGGVRRT